MLVSNEVANTCFHLFGRLISKGKGQDVPRFKTHLQQMGYLKGKNAGLTRTSTSNNQLWSIGINHSLALIFV